MVASPNVDFGGASGLANFLQDQQRQIDENGRRSTYPFSAGPGGGTFQIFPDPTIVDGNGKPVVDTVLKYGDGTTALSVRPGLPQFGSKQQMVLRDLGGNITYATDEAAGYGLAAPLYNYTLQVLFAGTSSASNAAGVEVVVADCSTPFYNPVVFARALLPMPNGVTWSARFVVTDGTTTVTSSTSNFTGSGYVRKILLLPSNFISNQGTKLQLLVNPGTAGSTVVYPGTCVGAPKSFYDVNQGLQ
jgi:hypothetical protein